MEYIQLATDVAREAGRFLKHFSDEHALHVERKGSDYDFVTDADKASQELIRRRILDKCPSHSFIGEEDGISDSEIMKALARAGEDDWHWVVDPLDGTLNYIHHLGGYSVSVALLHAGEPVCGAIYVPENDEMYSAELGSGAYLNGKRLHGSDCTKLSAALVTTGYAVSDLALRKRSCAWIDAAAMASLNMRNLGSAARTIALTAAGRIEAYFEIGPHPWDVSAGILMNKEAGCRVSTILGEPYRIGDPSIMVCAPGVHDELCALIRGAYVRGE